MKKTRVITIQLLKKMFENAKAVQEIYEEKGDKETAEFFKGEKLALNNVINLLQDREYFFKIWDIYNK